MALTREQIKLQQEALMQGGIFERLINKMPEDTKAAWYKLVGHMREYYHMDELWDGKELIFCRAGETEALVKMVLTPDKVLVSIPSSEAGQVSFEPATPEDTDKAIQMLKTKGLPNRVLPDDNIRISSGGGRCDLCLFNNDTIAKKDRRVEMSIGMAKCYGDDTDFTTLVCNGKCGTPDESCLIIDIGHCTPGLTADEVTHIIFPYWWTKSSIKKENA